MSNVFMTGGSGGIGSAIHKVFEERGSTVYAPTSLELNLFNSDAIEKYFNESRGEIDVIIHCAGINILKKLNELSDNDLYEAMKINCLSFVNIIKIGSKHMIQKKYGKVLAISSLYGSFARLDRMPYVASKHALQGIIKSFACEYAKYNINVNALSPGFVDTQLTRKNNSKEKIAEIESRIPLGRMAKPDEIARAAWFLCSKDNSYITGQNIIVDGGFMASGGQYNV